MTPSFLSTLLAAILLMGLVVCGLGIGWLLTGRSRLQKGCGWTPKSDNPNNKCGICGRSSPCDETDDKSES